MLVALAVLGFFIVSADKPLRIIGQVIGTVWMWVFLSLIAVCTFL